MFTTRRLLTSILTPLDTPALLVENRAAMSLGSFDESLNAQIANEYAAHQQYVASAVYYDSQTLPQLARFFYSQALDERDHALMIIQYLLDANAHVVVPGVAAPRADFEDIVAPVALALEQERSLGDDIHSLAATARAGNDYTSEQFLQWFIKDQVTEIARMSDLLRVVERSHDDPMEVENFIAREHAARATKDPTAPRIAGSRA